MRRFYKQAAAAKAAGGAGAYAVLLDGKPVKTPARQSLEVESRPLAEAIAAEWQSQDEDIRPESMPLMGLVCSALDLIPKQRDREVAELASYGDTDMLCYRADRPASLVERQAACWQPLLDWAARHLDAPLEAVTGISHRPQPRTSLAALRRAIEAHDDLQLAALSLAVRASGSLVIGLSVSHGALTSAAAFEAAELDSSYEIERWGEDSEAEKRRAGVRQDIDASARLFALHGGL